MKKILSVIVSVIVSVGMNAQVVKVYDTVANELVETYTNSVDHTYKVVFEEAPTTGTAKAKLNGTDEEDVTWVQLWSGGPKFATINVGQTVTNYSNITTATYSLANVGGLYTCGGTNNSNGAAYNDDHYTGTETTLPADYDTATKLWGSAWRMPTNDELNSLTNSTYCTLEWCDGEEGDGHKQYVSGCKLKGMKVSGIGAYASNNVFFPAAGSYDSDGNSVQCQGGNCDYWSSTLDFGEYANYLYFDSYGPRDMPSPGSCKYGYSVRAVLKN